jgi:hypothetical protein
MDDAEFKATTDSIVNRVTKKLVSLRVVGRRTTIELP